MLIESEFHQFELNGPLCGVITERGASRIRLSDFPDSTSVRYTSMYMYCWTAQKVEGFPTHLTFLKIQAGQFPRLPEFPNSLRELVIEYASHLTELGRLPPKLEKLTIHCAEKLLRLPPLPETLRELSISRTDLAWLPSFPKSLRSVTFTPEKGLSLAWLPLFPNSSRPRTIGPEGEPLRLTAAQIEHVDDLQLAQDFGETGVFVEGYSPVRERSLPQTLDEAIVYIYEAVGASPREGSLATLQLLNGLSASSVKDQSTDAFKDVLVRVLTEHSSERGGVGSIACDMKNTLAILARYPDLWPHVLETAERVDRNACVNQPVLTWRNIAALVSAHDAAFSARNVTDAIGAARPLVTYMLLDEAVVAKLTHHREKLRREAWRLGRQDDPSDAFRALEPEISNAMLSRLSKDKRHQSDFPALPGAPRDVVFATAVKEFVDENYEACISDVKRALSGGSMLGGAHAVWTNALCRRPDFADWWEQVILTKHTPNIRKEIERIKRETDKKLELLEDQQSTGELNDAQYKQAIEALGLCSAEDTARQRELHSLLAFQLREGEKLARQQMFAPPRAFAPQQALAQPQRRRGPLAHALALLHQ